MNKETRLRSADSNNQGLTAPEKRLEFASETRPWHQFVFRLELSKQLAESIASSPDALKGRRVQGIHKQDRFSLEVPHFAVVDGLQLDLSWLREISWLEIYTLAGWSVVLQRRDELPTSR